MSKRKALFFTRGPDFWEEGRGKVPAPGPDVTVATDPPDDHGGKLEVGAWVRVKVPHGDIWGGRIEARFGRVWRVRVEEGQEAWFDADRILPPTEADRTYGRARDLQDQGDEPAAAQLFEQALRQEPAHLPALEARLYSAVEQDDWPAVIRWADAYLERKPDNSLARFNQAIALMRLGRLDEALGVADALLARDLRSSDGHWIRAAVLAALDRPADAVSSVRKAIALGADPSEVRDDEDLAGLKKLKPFKDAVARRAFAQDCKAFIWPEAAPATLADAWALLDKVGLPPERFLLSAAGAPPDALAAAEKEAGVVLPSELRELLARHDGIEESWTNSGPFIAGTRGLAAEQQRFRAAVSALRQQLPEELSGDELATEQARLPEATSALIALGHEQGGHIYFVLDTRVRAVSTGAHPVAHYDTEDGSHDLRHPSLAHFLGCIACEAHCDPQKQAPAQLAKLFPRGTIAVETCS
jgi:hypothetical protein